MVDRVIDDLGHADALIGSSNCRAGLPRPECHGLIGRRFLRGRCKRFNSQALAYEVLALYDNASTIGDPADPHERWPVLNDRHGDEGDFVAGTNHADTEVTRSREYQGRERYPRGRHRRHPDHDFCRDPIRDSATGILHFDLDTIGTGRWARRFCDVADAARYGLTRDQADIGGLANLDAAELAPGRLDHCQHRIKRHDLRDLSARHGETRLANLYRHVANDARPRRADNATLAFGFCGGKCRIGRLLLRFQIYQFELRQGAALDELAFGVDFGLTLRCKCPRLLELRFARLIRQDGDHIASLHDRTTAHLELREHASRTRGHHHLAVRFGATGQHELAAVRLDLALDDADAKQLGLDFVRSYGSRALALVRN